MSLGGRRAFGAAAAALFALLLLAPAGAALAACGGSTGTPAPAASASPSAAATPPARRLPPRAATPSAAATPTGASGAGGQPATVRRDLAYARVSPSEKLDLYLPAGGSGPYPVIVAIHGGGFMSGDKSDGQVAPTLLGVARGYAVASINYRLSGEAKFPAQIEDVKAADPLAARQRRALQAWTRRASPSGATPPAATWRPWPARRPASPRSRTRRSATPASPKPCRRSSTGSVRSRCSRSTPTSAPATPAPRGTKPSRRSSRSTSARRCGRSREGQGRRSHHLHRRRRPAVPHRARHRRLDRPRAAVAAPRRRAPARARPRRGDAQDLPGRRAYGAGDLLARQRRRGARLARRQAEVDGGRSWPADAEPRARRPVEAEPRARRPTDAAWPAWPRWPVRGGRGGLAGGGNMFAGERGAEFGAESGAEFGAESGAETDA